MRCREDAQKSAGSSGSSVVVIFVSYSRVDLSDVGGTGCTYASAADDWLRSVFGRSLITCRGVDGLLRVTKEGEVRGLAERIEKTRQMGGSGRSSSLCT